MTEKWRAVPGWEGTYEVSDQGRVRSLPRSVRGGFTGHRLVLGRVLQPVKRTSGHRGVILTDGDRRERPGVHQLVARAFLGPCPNGHEVCHNNGDPTDNRAENLRYGTRHENIMDAVKHRAHWQTKKDVCPRGHPLEAPNLPPWLKRGRECLACKRAGDYVRYHPEMRDKFREIADDYYQKIQEKKQ